jgi:hypothetical protein
MGAISFNPARVIERLSRERDEQFSRLASLAGGQAQNQLSAAAAEAQKREEHSANPARTQNDRGTPAKPANLLNRDWLDGLSKVDVNRAPVSFPRTWWADFVSDAHLFLATWSQQAADLGWTTLDLFGAHRSAPAARYSCMGLLLLLRGGRVIALTAASAVIEQRSGARLTYTRRAVESDVVPVWDLIR